jgi:signal peptidase I
VSDSADNPATGAVGDAVFSQPASSKKRRLLAAFLSALAPGAGQLLLAQRRKGIVLLLVFGVVLSGVWPLRVPRSFWPFLLFNLGWLALSLYAGCTALFRHQDPIARRTSKWWFVVILLFTYLGINVLYTPLFLVAGFRALKFNSSAMENTLLKGDQFVIDEPFYSKHPVARNDLVVLRGKDYQTVKRVVAIGGDTIEGRNREIIINGQLLDEPFIRHSLPPGTNPEMDTFGPVTVAAGKYFVMGDNRDVSFDSRLPDFGLLDAQAITGKPLYIYRSPIKGRLGKKLD